MTSLKILAVAILVSGGLAVSHAGTLNLTVGGETTGFEATRCNTTPYTDGRVVVEAEVTAVGRFRGRPASLFMTRGAVDNGMVFSTFALYLTDLSPERREMPPKKAVDEIAADYGTLNGEGANAIAADYSHEKLAGLSTEEVVAKMNEMKRRLDEHREAMAARRVPYTRSDGQVTIEGSTIRFEGAPLELRDGEPGEAFADLSGDVRATVTCSP